MCVSLHVKRETVALLHAHTHTPTHSPKYSEEPPSSPSSSDPNSGSILHCWAYKLKSGRLQWHAPLSSSLPAAASSSVRTCIRLGCHYMVS